MIKYKREVVFNCPICNSEAANKWVVGKDLLTQISDDEFQYVKCVNCNTLYLQSRPTDDTVHIFYSENYHPYIHDKSISIFEKLKHRISKIFKSTYLNFNIAPYENLYVKNESKLTFMDFGCGAGKFLDRMKNLGWNTVGVDFSAIAINGIVKRGHVGCNVSNFDNEIKAESINFVRMNHVVEHLYNPESTLRDIHAKLSLGGLLHIAVPNPSGVSALVFGNNWHGLDCPRHVILCPPQVLVQVLSLIGYKDIDIKKEFITKDFIRSLGYKLAKSGFIDYPKVNGLMNSYLLKITLFLPLFIAYKLGYADRYHITCIK
jgi:SAM-dependent methyltransferase